MTYNAFGKEKCESHNIHYNRLCEIVLQDIQHYAKLALADPKSLINDLNESNNVQKRETERKTRRDHEEKLKRLNELERLLQRLFEESASGLVNDDNYAIWVTKYQQEQSTLAPQADELSEQLKALESYAHNSEKWAALIAKYAELKELNADIIEELCEKILIHKAEQIDSKRVQKIEIFYRFMGSIGEPPVTVKKKGWSQ